MHTKSYSTPLKEIKELSKKKDTVCSWIEKLNIKMEILLSLICRFSIIPVNILTSCFADMDTVILKFIQKCR